MAHHRACCPHGTGRSASSLLQIDPFTNARNASPGQLQAAKDYWEYAALSNNVYGYKPEVVLPDGWKRLDVNDDVAGFYAETWLFSDKNGSQKIVVVFRGTEGVSNINDMLFGNVLLTPAQESIARDYAKFVATLTTDYPNAKVSTTGHSLGGALAKVAADELGTTAVVFNTSPRGPESGDFVYIEETGDGLDRLRPDNDNAVQYNFSNAGPAESHDITLLAGMMKSLAYTK